MKYLVLPSAALILAFGALPASAQQEPAQGPGAAQAEANAGEEALDPDEKICRKIEAPLNSRIRARKTCLTRSEWAEKAKAEREVVQDLRLRGSISNSPTSPAG